MVYFLIWLPFLVWVGFSIKFYWYQDKKISILDKKHLSWIKNRRKL